MKIDQDKAMKGDILEVCLQRYDNILAPPRDHLPGHDSAHDWNEALLEILINTAIIFIYIFLYKFFYSGNPSLLSTCGNTGFHG